MKSQHPGRSPQSSWRSLFKQNSSVPPFPLTQRSTSYKHHARFPELCCDFCFSGQFLTNGGGLTFGSEDNAASLRQVPARYSQMEQDALKLAQEISAEYWAVSSLTGGSGACWTLVEADWRDFNPKPPSVRHAVGENVNEFFFRVASLAFETSVLAELEKSGSRQIGQVVSEYPSPQLGCLRRAAALKPCLPSVSGINSDSRNLYTSSKKKQSNCCQ